ncbi:cation acetate symporter [Angustibacter sp. McL0619]|uniref:sodium/solute symporter n=1 Tax=Angustibacter sp. McL0619 TaxID=3415676 RepID=UPI003CF50DCB
MGDAQLYSVVAVLLVSVATVVVGAFGLRMSRTTSDFYVASRAVSPRWNASAIGGEYLSAASFLGVAGLVLVAGTDMLWFPVGYTTGYLVLLVLVAAPLRRSGAYTLPDFAEGRLESREVRRAASVLVVGIGWLYLVPQLQGAGIALRAVTGAPVWMGAAIVATVVVLNVVAGGMRSITFVQAFQYWLKLTAIALPMFFILLVWHSDGAPSPATAEWLRPLGGASGRDHPLYSTYSIVLALFFGTMGLPHVLVRFYTNPDGRAARRTTLVVIALLGVFYLFPPLYGALGRIYAADLLAVGHADTVVLLLPERVVPGVAGQLLSALTTAGAFAAFLSTSSGLVMSVSGVLHQDLLSRWARPGRRGTGRRAASPRRPESLRGFRAAAVASIVVPFVLSLFAGALSLADTVGLAFAVAASTFCPLLVLGIWWRGLTRTGALTGLVVGGALASAAVVITMVGGTRDGWTGALLAQPAAWTVPLAFATMISVSLATPRSVPPHVARTMVRLHAPEDVDVDRSSR